MIELSGRTVRSESNSFGDIEISISGLRPGEKLYEELLIGDNPSVTAHPRIMKAHEAFRAWSDLRADLRDLETYVENNEPGPVLDLLQKLVSGYQPSKGVFDWVSAVVR